MDSKIEKLLASGEITEAITLLEKWPENKRNEEWFMLLGELYYKTGRNTDALNKFNALLRFTPDNQKAKTYVAMIHDVLDFYCKDLLNP